VYHLKRTAYFAISK